MVHGILFCWCGVWIAQHCVESTQETEDVCWWLLIKGGWILHILHLAKDNCTKNNYTRRQVTWDQAGGAQCYTFNIFVLHKYYKLHRIIESAASPILSKLNMNNGWPHAERVIFFVDFIIEIFSHLRTLWPVRPGREDTVAWTRLVTILFSVWSEWSVAELLQYCCHLLSDIFNTSTTNKYRFYVSQLQYLFCIGK